MSKISQLIGHFLRWFHWYTHSDVVLVKKTCWDGKKELVEGFYFHSKKPFSKAYQYHAAISVRDIHKILNVIHQGIAQKSEAVDLVVISGLGKETFSIWKGSLQKASDDLQELIEELEALGIATGY